MYYMPVCGCNNKTYSNTCVAQSAGILQWTDGECSRLTSPEDSESLLAIFPTYAPSFEPTLSQACYDESQDNVDRTKCDDTFGHEVCGCDGKSYMDSCVARNSGLKKWTDGACPLDDKHKKNKKQQEQKKKSSSHPK
jgi:hypothetical protein